MKVFFIKGQYVLDMRDTVITAYCSGNAAGPITLHSTTSFNIPHMAVWLSLVHKHSQEGSNFHYPCILFIT